MEDEFGDIPDFESLVGSSRPASSAPGARPSAGKSAPSTKIQQPKPQALPTRPGPSAILVSARQKGNPILNHVRLLPWEYADIPADYVVGNTSCVLFLSLKYHRLHPEYIYSRIRALSGKYNLRLLLTMVDIPNHEDSLNELSKTSLVNNLTLILCWSAPEAAHYLELFKSCENAQPTAIRTQQAQSYKDSLVEFVTTPRSINKSDAASLISTFGSLQAAMNAQPEQISSVPGWGERKVEQWCGAVREEFRIHKAGKKSAEPRRAEGRQLHDNLATEEDPDILVNMESEPVSRGSATGTPNLNRGRRVQQFAGEGPAVRTDKRDESAPATPDDIGIGSGETISKGIGSKNSAANNSAQGEVGDGIMSALARLRENGG